MFQYLKLRKVSLMKRLKAEKPKYTEPVSTVPDKAPKVEKP